MSTHPPVNLDDTIRMLRKQVQKIQERNTSISEEDTKRVLITPLLQALRWDILDLDEVRNEYRSQSPDNPVDYALLLNRTPCLFLEAKAVKHSLDDRKWLSQTVGYAATAGVEWCVLTNGDEYRIYNAHAPVDADRKLFKKVVISDADRHRETVDTLELISKDRMGEKQINTLWQASFVDSKVKAVLEELVRGDKDLIDLILQKESTLKSEEIRSSLQRADVRVTFPVMPLPPVPSVVPKLEPKPDPPKDEPNTGETSQTPARRIVLKDLLDAHLITAPVQLEARHKKQLVTAQIEADGSVTFNGQSYPSLSAAGAAAVQRNTCNGWDFWYYRDRQGQPRSLSELKKSLEK